MLTLGEQWSVERTGLAAPAPLCVEPGEWIILGLGESANPVFGVLSRENGLTGE